MRRRLFVSLLIAAAVSLAGLLPIGTARAQALAARTASDSIWCGLWYGSNFDFSGGQSCTVPPSSGTPGGSSGQYVALGDSVSAGLGLDDSAADVPCGRSADAYPAMVATALQLPLTNASCSGAKMGDLFTEQAVSGPDLPPQLDTAFATGTPALITITAGANDVHWADFIRACYTFDCTDPSYSYAAQAYLALLRGKEHIVLSEIALRSHGSPPKVLITGYYHPLSANCLAGQQNLTAAELTWLNSQTDALNQTLQTVAAHYSFAHFVPVDFSGHDICSAGPWAQGPSDPAPFHPTLVGQQQIAAAVITAAQ